MLAHRKEVRLEEGPEQSAERSRGKLAWAGAREFAEAGILYPSSSSPSSPSPCSLVTHTFRCAADAPCESKLRLKRSRASSEVSVAMACWMLACSSVRRRLRSAHSEAYKHANNLRIHYRRVR